MPVRTMAKDEGNQGGKAQKVRQILDDEMLEQADAAGVDVDDVIAEKMGGFGASTIANFVEAELGRQIEAESADTIKGIIMGSRDRYGANWPRRHSVVRSSGDHAEVNTWSGTLPGTGGKDVRVPTGGAIVSLRCEYDSEYDSYDAKRIEGADKLGHDELVQNLREVALSPSDLDRDDEYEVVVVEGEIGWISPHSVFTNGERQGDGPVLMKDERGEHRLHFEVGLRRQNGYTVRGTLERLKAARRYIDVPDLEALAEAAVEQYDSPDDQTQFLRDGLGGTPVLMVGSVSNVDVDRDGGERRTYVDINLSALVSTDRPGVPDPGQAQLDDESAGGADGTPDGSDDGAGDEQATDDATEPAPQEKARGSEGRTIEDVRSDIEDYCELVGVEPSDLTVELAREKLSLDDPDVVVREALKGAGDSDTDLEGGGDGGGDTASKPVDNPLDRIEAGGTYNCPATSGDGNDCLFQGGRAELVAHVNNEHQDGVAPDEIEDWVAAQLE